MNWNRELVRLFDFRTTGKHEFIYDFTFSLNYNWPVKVTVDYEFDSVDGVETISRFPHGQRRVFATNILQKYSPQKFHHLTDADICNPFARGLARLFNDNLQVYWMRRQTDTVLIITGFFQNNHSLNMSSLFLTL